MHIQINISSSKPNSLEKREGKTYVILEKYPSCPVIVFEFLIFHDMRAFCAAYYATSNIPIESAIQVQDLLVIEFTCKSIKSCSFLYNKIYNSLSIRILEVRSILKFIIFGSMMKKPTPAII